ncbi:glycosylphosphatidylinositol anchor biosynthesis, variant 2 [Entomophthora muscae]|uniref:Glycosylphosphatidylinositol anchor biosynthesis, variant 2 n=2 Tax=Entomophthora muscae TaxID=34485 RepID=A0ACC2U067_9FUNG|nr:glycosylphosphatidylinositol anchor biosynthesis, variant 2 [Entomophthora muscae]
MEKYSMQSNPSTNTEPWKKILYINQPYADNYTDSSFLKLLRKNEHIRRDSFLALAYQATITISLHLACICFFVVTFINLNNETWSAFYVLSSAAGLNFLGLSTLSLSLEKESALAFQLRPVLKSSILLMVMLFGLAPVLKTLTLDISSDSIWALTVLALLVNALFHDYSSAAHLRIVFPGSISTNAAIFASVLLASRLDSTLQVAALLSFSIVWFALFPLYQRYFRVSI